MVYCSVACCTNGNHNRRDLSYFVFPSDGRLPKWLNFCRRADAKFAVEAKKAKAGEPNNLRICSVHFLPESYKRTLNGRRKIIGSAVPQIFKPSELKRSQRELRYESASKKRRLNEIKTPEPVCGHQ